ncbi:MAG: plastocyanin/azurin family copper-binding protein [Actinomycetota bacterium]
MSQKNPLRYFALFMALGLVFAACSSDDAGTAESSDTTMTEDMDMDAEHSEEFAFGDPMESSDADRVIEITANDDFTFLPSGATVTTGETVTFRVTNTGAIPHDFVLGDEHMQDEHEAEMAEMGGDMAMHDEPNAFVIEPGETKEMTWHMTEPGEILFGCHQPGHYVAGMKGTVVVSG